MNLISQCQMFSTLFFPSLFSLASLTTIVIASLTGFNGLVNLIGSFRKRKSNASEIAWAADHPIFYIIGTYW